MKKLLKVLALIISLGTIIGLSRGAYLHFDNKFGKAEAIAALKEEIAKTNLYIQKVDNRLDFKLIEDRKYRIKERNDDLEKRFGDGCSNCPQPTKEEFKKNHETIKEIDKTLDKMIPVKQP